MSRLLDALLSNLKAYRHWQGGHWERWLCGSMGEHDLWLRVATCSRVTGDRPGLDCKGTPTCEDY